MLATKSLGSLYTESTVMSTGGCLGSLAGVDKIVLLPLSFSDFTVHSLLIAYIRNQWYTEMQRKRKLEMEIGNA